jgi:hypothetical protein
MVTRVLSGLVLVGALVACGGSGGPAPVEGALANEFDGAPQWVLRGCSAFSGEKAAVCGRGGVKGTRNPGLAMSAATGRARTDLARNLSVKVKAMLKDYQATTTGGENFGTAANDEQHIVDVSKQITDTTLSGTQVVDSWVSKGGTLWVLVKLDVDAFKNAISGMKQLDAKTMKGIMERADKAFKELDEATTPPSAE